MRQHSRRDGRGLEVWLPLLWRSEQRLRFPLITELFDILHTSVQQTSGCIFDNDALGMTAECQLAHSVLCSAEEQWAGGEHVAGGCRRCVSPSLAALHHRKPEAQADFSQAKGLGLLGGAGQKRQEHAAATCRAQVIRPGCHVTRCPSPPHHSSSEAPDLLSQFCLELLPARGSSCACTQHAQQDQAQDALDGQVTLVGQESLWVELAPRTEHIPEVAHASHHAFRKGLQVCISQLGLDRTGQAENLR